MPSLIGLAAAPSIGAMLLDLTGLNELLAAVLAVCNVMSGIDLFFRARRSRVRETPEMQPER